MLVDYFAVSDYFLLIIESPRYPKYLFLLNSVVTSSKLLKLYSNQKICLESVQKFTLA